MSTSNFPLLATEALKIQRGTGNQAQLILNGTQNCAFTLESGNIHYLAGPSGVGKSTLLWTLARLHPLPAGLLWLNGQLHTKIALTRWRAEVALLPQQPVIQPGTVVDNLLYPLRTFQIQKERLKERNESLPTTEKLLTKLESIGLHNIPLERDATSLSGGQQARLALIRLLLTKPKLILADEPTAGLDEEATKLVFDTLHQFCQTGGAVLFTSHVHGEDINTAARITLTGNANLLFQTQTNKHSI